ncbi:apoptogenic protein 1 [Entomortierella parvispora]|uniref:Apoptogenic protein 1 n=1 Tax=Entomortierella parvispora TaxID=205924 RepID=A0A9P3H8U7_9FUNG|nr:apoptogenic protein 1 [Entomortierella parvispora]
MNALKTSTRSITGISRRYTSAAASTSASTTTTTSSRKRESLDPATNTDKFLVGTPHPVSNLRPVLYPVPKNESEDDRIFRERRERVDAFNQNFWVNNNTMFNKAKAEYEAKIRAQNGNVAVTTEELSVFYKDFLDKAYERQMNYNRQWWVENIGLLLPAAKAAVRKWTR